MTGPGSTTRRTGRSALAVVLGGLALVEVVAGPVLALLAFPTWGEALGSFVVTNGLMGASFGLCGLLVAWHRPRHPLGWLLIATGLGHATSAVMAPVTQLLHDHGAPLWSVRLAVTVFMFAWPWSIGLFLPLVLLLFPDGHLPGRAWRYVAWAVVVTSPLFVLEMVSGVEPVKTGVPLGYLAWDYPDGLAWLWTVSELRVLLALLLGVVALVVRYRRAGRAEDGETQRRQLLWLLLAGLVVLAAVVPWSFVAGTPIAVLFAIPLVPLAIAVAVIRHQLLDIRLVVSRAVAWLSLSLVALLAYAGLVALLDRFVSRALGSSAFATVLVAVALAPLLPRVQREVDRWMYGDRRDPARVAGRLGEQLVVGDGRGLTGVAGALRSALRLPYVAITGSGTTYVGGEPTEHVVSVPLEYAGEQVGLLEVGLRGGERDLSAADAGVLRLLAAPLAVALRAMALSADLQGSRERLVVAREEERRRLRRDLHDGLGPTLTGIALAADAAENYLDVDPRRSQELLGSVRTSARTAIADVRRLIDDLRPAALDEVGLVGALRQQAERLRWRADGTCLDVRLVAPDELPALPAAVEVAAYRIATEALLNVSRHAEATSAVVELRCNGTLELSVTDDGSGAGPGSATWAPGMGLQAMQERASEVGGRFEAGPAGTGGRVFVSIPLGAP